MWRKNMALVVGAFVSAMLTWGYINLENINGIWALKLSEDGTLFNGNLIPLTDVRVVLFLFFMVCVVLFSIWLMFTVDYNKNATPRISSEN